MAIGLTTLTGPGVALAAGAPPGLVPARAQTGLSLGSHIVLACFGVAFPAMISCIVALSRAMTPQPRLARRWARVAGLFVAVGAVSGTVLSFEMGLLWPGLMGRFGDVTGLPFAIEGLSAPARSHRSLPRAGGTLRLPTAHLYRRRGHAR